MKLEEAKKYVKELKIYFTEEELETLSEDDQEEFDELNNAIDIVLNHLIKQDKIIELMAEHIEDNLTDDICNKENCYANEYINGHCQKCLECIKQYFEKKVEESE